MDREEVKSILVRLLSELPAHSAEIIELPDHRGKGTTFELRPANPGAASIHLHVEDDLDIVDFSIGRATWELPIEGKDPQAKEGELLAEIERMCRAVIRGDCGEGKGFLSYKTSIYDGSGRPYVMNSFLHVSSPHRERKFAPYTDSECER